MNHPTGLSSFRRIGLVLLAAWIVACGGGVHTNDGGDGAIDIGMDGISTDGSADGRDGMSSDGASDVSSMDGSIDGALDAATDGGADGRDAMGDVPTECVPQPETCNGMDDDCNGMIDDGLGRTTCGAGACEVTVDNCVDGHAQPCMPGTPGTEVCDGIDNNCDGTIDDGLGSTTCGTGACLVTQDNCVAGVARSCVAGTPATEVCNGIDDDCNGMVDDLAPITCGTGACQVTVPACTSGAPATCTPGSPSAEICDAIDNNCDGTVDEGDPGGGASCVTGNPGVCGPGTNHCVAGHVVCRANEPAGSPEVCDGVDNNCDGQIDEGNPGGGAACTTSGQGACQAGTITCTMAALSCVANNTPHAETCNGIDDDCNGTTDEGLGSTTCGVGACSVTQANCIGGVPHTCAPAAPQTETCNGIDDDCNGSIDEGLGSTTCGVGPCQRTVQNCVAGAPQTCVAAPPGVETCNGLDDDCDGIVDNGNPGGGVTCATGEMGVCAAGTTACTAGSIACVRNVAPSAESCDGLDNNCDGQTDEGNPGGGGACSTGMSGPCGSGTVTCTSGALACLRNVEPTPETCDSIDNDCNGLVDDGNPGGGVACATGMNGACSAGTTACTSGAIVCTRNTNPSSEVCDAIDNDCDGAVDNGVPLATCGVGACARTGTTCTASSCTPGTASAEICDGVDNDCNGVVDNGLALATCGTGACSRTGTTCDPLSCTPGTPSSEVCDNIDNNCDGAVDEGISQSCYTGPAGTNGVGACRGGTQTCTSGTFGACVGQVVPRAEICDALDNDCDGQVDEGVTQSCYTGPAGTNGVGVCHGGTQTCTFGSFGACVGQVVPGAESCNGSDDNCNGTIDEGVKTTYYRDADNDSFGNASVTTQACSVPTGYVSNNTDCNDSQAAVHPGATEVCNGVDDNCDGRIDEGVRITYFRDADGDGYGNAFLSTLACSAPSGYVPNSTDCNDSTAAISPGAPEVCNGMDDNCNGAIDDGNPGGGVSCGVCNMGTTVCSASGSLTCMNPNNGLGTYYRDADSDGYGNAAVTTQACSQPAGYVTNATDCNDSNAAIRPGATEVCNGADDNCNGATDEGNPGGGVSCNTGMSGVCAAGTTACSGGSLRCNQNVAPSAETCNSLDDNCNGMVDDSFAPPDGVPTTCAAASGLVVTVAPGRTASVSGYTGADDWFTVSFTSVGGAGTYFHPRVSLTSNPGTQFKIQVFTSCGVQANGCTGNQDTWEELYGSDPNSCSSAGGFTCTDNTSRVTQFLVHVVRVSGAPFYCTGYTVTASNL